MLSPAWSATTRLLVILALVALLVWLLVTAMPMVEALIIAGLAAYLLDPLVRWIMLRTRWSRKTAARLVFIALLLLAASLPAAFGALAFDRMHTWGDSLNEAIQAIEDWLSQPLVIMGYDLSPRQLVNDLGQAFASAVASIPGGSLDILSTVTTNLLWALLIVVGFYYFLIDGPGLRTWLESQVPPAYQLEIQQLLSEVGLVWSLFLRAQLLIFVILAALMAVGAWVVILLYRLGLIPFSTLGLVITLLLVYALISQVDNIWLRPQLFGRQLNMHPGVIFVGLIAGLALGGILGVILAVPIIASIKVIGRYLYCKLFDLPLWFEPAPPGGPPPSE